MIAEKLSYKTLWTIRRYADDAAFARGEASEVVGSDGQQLPAVSEIEGNLLLNEGIQLLLDLLIGAGGTAYNNANSYLGVGDSTTAASAGQTDLQAATNKLRKAMDATYPQVSTNTCVFRSSFGSSDANWAWAEWATFNASSSGTMLNRKVEALGTKSTGTWTLTVTLSLA